MWGRYVLATFAAVGVLAAACGGSEAGVRDASDEDSTSSSPANGNPSSTPPAGNSGECLDGTFLVSRIAGKETVSSAAGDGAIEASGGGLRIAFTGGDWTMTGDGARPMAGRVGAIDVQITINGSSHGRFVHTGTTYGFEQEGAQGTVTLAGLGRTENLPMSDVGPAIAPSGTATVTCTGDQVTLDSESVTLTMARESGGSGGTGGGTNPPAQGGATKVINESGTSIRHDCAGGGVVVNGSDDAVTLTGSCPNVVVNGDDNSVTIARVDAIQVNGDGNVVTWSAGASRGEPQVTTLGSGNRVTKG